MLANDKEIISRITDLKLADTKSLLEKFARLSGYSIHFFHKKLNGRCETTISVNDAEYIGEAAESDEACKKAMMKIFRIMLKDDKWLRQIRSLLLPGSEQVLETRSDDELLETDRQRPRVAQQFLKESTFDRAKMAVVIDGTPADARAAPRSPELPDAPLAQTRAHEKQLKKAKEEHLQRLERENEVLRSFLSNLGYDVAQVLSHHLHLDQPRRALPGREDTGGLEKTSNIKSQTSKYQLKMIENFQVKHSTGASHGLNAAGQPAKPSAAR